MNSNPQTDLLYRLADDDLIMGHRNSEWTGFGPILEEDIAFASIAQDQIGHAQAYYHLLHELGEGEPDQLAFHRSAAAFRSCHLVEWPGQSDYAFSLVRHLLYDTAKQLRLQALSQSSHPQLASLAQRMLREVKYHCLHAQTWVQQLGTSTEEARLRMQSALNEAWPMAQGLFEPTAQEAAIAEAGIQPKEAELQARWTEAITTLLQKTHLKLPIDTDPTPYLGGRRGYHSEHLAPMLAEMTEVFVLDPTATW